MKILLIAATSFELAGIIEFLESEGKKRNFFEYEYGADQFLPLVTGVGAMRTAFSIARYAQSQHIDIAFNLGVAGGVPNKYDLGEVVQVVDDRFADLGIEENDGSFTDLFDLELEERDKFPYEGGLLKNKTLPYSNIPFASGITVNCAHGSEASIDRIRSKYEFDIESMEGAAFFYACKMLDIPCYQLRAISNIIEPRARENWDIDQALENLNDAMVSIIKEGFDQFPKKKSSLS